ncbi:MAG: hypothetical protein Q8P18_01905 [Pseudomonadota bacterium]|nr:hypothetical protein [Pseudomonadota bacterium]
MKGEIDRVLKPLWALELVKGVDEETFALLSIRSRSAFALT